MENVRPPATAMGTELFAKEPLPSWPEALNPQQYAAPAAVRPHVRNAPADSETNAGPPVTATGTELELNEPLPSSPKSLVPQQYASPPVVRPHANPPPDCTVCRLITVTVIAAVSLTPSL